MQRIPPTGDHRAVRRQRTHPQPTPAPSDPPSQNLPYPPQLAAEAEHTPTLGPTLAASLTRRSNSTIAGTAAAGASRAACNSNHVSVVRSTTPSATVTVIHSSTSCCQRGQSASPSGTVRSHSPSVPVTHPVRDSPRYHIIVSPISIPLHRARARRPSPTASWTPATRCPAPPDHPRTARTPETPPPSQTRTGRRTPPTLQSKTPSSVHPKPSSRVPRCRLDAPTQVPAHPGAFTLATQPFRAEPDEVPCHPTRLHPQMGPHQRAEQKIIPVLGSKWDARPIREREGCPGIFRTILCNNP
jgi:hypothetical protein